MKKDEDTVSFYIKVLMAAWNIEFVFVLQASWKKERCKETKWRYDRVEKAACIVGHARDCVRLSLAKVMFAVGRNKLWSHCEFCVSSGLGERRACLH